MKSYINVITELLFKAFNEEKNFYLIKLENFPIPAIYLEVCRSLNEFFKDKDIQFIAKLSFEKYSEWQKNSNNIESLEELDTNNWIEKNEHLTKWRNYPFTDMKKNTAIILMGTEDVEDKGGLAEFYTISPETIEIYIGGDYCRLACGSYSEESEKKINNIFSDIFRYAEKDLLKVSNYFEVNSELSDFQLINNMLSNLYPWWGIPNINNGLGTLSKNKIDLIEKGYKFSRRIGFDLYQRESRLNETQKRIDEFLLNTMELSKIESEELGVYNLDYDKFKEDLINYIKGVNITEIKDRLFNVNFELINKLLKIPKKEKTKGKPTKVTGDPFEALALPILLEVEELEDEEKKELNEITIWIDKVTLAKTKSIEEENKDKHSVLVTKWYNLVCFLQNIEELISRQYISNAEGGEVKVKIAFEDINGIEKYPFSIDNTKDFVDAGLLTSAKESESNSKVSLTYELKTNKKSQKEKYEWVISEQDSWIHTFNTFSDNKFNSLISDTYEILPIGFSEKVDLLINSKNEEEFYYFLESTPCEYTNVLKDIDADNELYVTSVKLGKSFVNYILKVREMGFFGSVFKNSAVTDFLTNYKELLNCCTEALKRDKREREDINKLSKCFLIINDKRLSSKSVKGVVVPPYHPVMLEKVVERYNYLSNAFKELFDEVILNENIKGTTIKKVFDRFNQLSTVVFSTSVFLGENNTFVTCRNNFGFYNIYGDIDQKNSMLGNNVYYADVDYEEDQKVSLSSSPISNYISYTVKEYLNTYPSKIDGFTICFIKPANYSDIISGLNDILKRLEQELEYKIKINLIIYTDDFRAIGSKYLSNWIESNFTEDDNIVLESSIKLLKYDDFNLNALNNYFDKSIEKSDIIFYNNIMKVKEVIPEYVKSVEVKSSENRFPAVYLPVKSHEESYRKLNITQTQFSCEYLHAQFMVYLKDLNSTESDYRIIKKVAISDADYKLLEIIHKKSNWVVVLDENIDVRAINNSNNKVIGFSTGEGYFGELNATISSEDSIKEDLKRLMKKRLSSKFHDWTKDQISYAANSCLRMTEYLDGSQILKALNPDDEAINNYLAYLMTYEIEHQNEVESGCIIRKIINLDAYSHLFEDLIDIKKLDSHNYRPDLLVLELFRRSNENKFSIKAKMIECKLAQHSYKHIEEARQQVESGYEHLSKIWNLEDNSVQRRFWLNQLYRILSYSNVNEIKNLKDYSSFDLSEICEGNFSIEFSKEMYLYWIDTFEDDIIEIKSGDDLSINEKHISHKVIRKLMLNGYEDSEIIDYEGSVEEIEQDNPGKSSENLDEIIDSDSDPDKSNNEDTRGNNINNNKRLYKPDEKNIFSGKLLEIFHLYQNEKFENEKNEIESNFEKLKLILQVKKVKIIPKAYIIGPDIVRYCFDLDYMNDVKDITKNQANIQLILKLNEPPYIFIEDGLIKMDTPRKKRQTVGLESMFLEINKSIDKYKDFKEHFYILLGADVLGQPCLLDLSDSNSPHLLIAGQTGSGKSVLLSSILASIMCFYTPDEVEMVLVDPKRVELTVFRESPFTKVVATEVDKAIELLKNLLSIMEERYKLFESEGVKNINEYNSKNPDKKLKRVLMVFDEYASMMMADKEYVKVIENTIVRLSQEARAAGVHLIICTQSPKADIITTTIRNNLNARIALKVADSVASKVILDDSGAETLLGKGDMLVKTPESSKLMRIKSPFVTNEELKNLISYLNKS